MESSNFENIKLTVVGLDLVRSSEFTAELERIMGGSKVVAEFFEEMEKSVYKSFSSVMSNPSEYEIFQRLEGDALRVSFEKTDDSYKFVRKLGQDFEEYHNTNSQVKKRVFRIGAATGMVYFNKSAHTKDPNKITSDYVLRTVARLRDGAKPGYFYVDKVTFGAFTDNVKKNLSEVLVKTKVDENDIPAWRYQVVSDISTSSHKTTTIDEIYDIFKKLNQDYQIKRVAQLIKMPKGIRPTNYNNLEEAKNIIVDWAEEQENGLNNLKDVIEQLIGVRG